MKRLIYIFPLLLALIFTSCDTDLPKIEDCEWKMRTVMGNISDTLDGAKEYVIATGEADAAYPDAKIIELKLTAKDGKITVSDITNGKTYSGSYKATNKTPVGTDYEITIAGISGYATVAKTKYYDEGELATLPINLGEYSLYFIPCE